MRPGKRSRRPRGHPRRRRREARWQLPEAVGVNHGDRGVPRGGCSTTPLLRCAHTVVLKPSGPWRLRGSRQRRLSGEPHAHRDLIRRRHDRLGRNRDANELRSGVPRHRRGSHHCLRDAIRLPRRLPPCKLLQYAPRWHRTPCAVASVMSSSTLRAAVPTQYCSGCYFDFCQRFNRISSGVNRW